MHQELKNPEIKQNNLSLDYMILEKISQDENIALQNFINDYIPKNKSIIYDTFYMIIKTVIFCKDCGMKKYSYQTFNMLNFVLKKVKVDKLR